MSRAIADTGETLVTLLRSTIGGQTPSQIALMSPADALSAGNIRLSLFLYSMNPVAEMRNDPELAVTPRLTRQPPLPLDLYYLITAYAPTTIADPTDRAVEAQRLLGAAMRVFHDTAVLTGSLLQGQLPRDEELRVTLQPITVEDLTRIWSVFPNVAYQPSASYLVTPVRLRSERVIDEQRVVERTLDVDQMIPSREGI